MKVDAKKPTQGTPAPKPTPKTVTRPLRKTPTALRSGFVDARPAPSAPRAKPAPANSSQPLADRNQNQFLPADVIASRDVNTVHAFITKSNKDAYQPELDDKQKQIDQAQKDLAFAVSQVNDPAQRAKIPELSAKIEQLNKEKTDLINQRDTQTTNAIADFDGAYAGSKNNFDTAVKSYQSYVFNHSSDPTTVSGPLFSTGDDDANSVDMNDIKQGGLGDCWVLASMAELAKNDPDAIKKMIRDNGNGTYTVTFHQQVPDTSLWGLITHATKDSTFEVTVNLDVPGSGAHANQADNSEVWPLVIEKAYAQYKQSYGALDGGFPADAMTLFTGEKATFMQTGNVTADQLSTWAKEGRNMVVDTCGADDAKLAEYGLHGGHAYAVQGVTTDADGNKYLVLYNPWGFDQPKPIPLSEAAKLVPDFYVN
jgi:hypothetical protein